MPADPPTRTDDDHAVPSDWAVSTIADRVPRGATVVVVGSDVDALCAALEAQGATVTAVAEGPAVPAAPDVDMTVLSGTPCHVVNEIGHLAAVRDAVSESAAVVVAVPNITWLPHRLAILDGRSPFGSGAVAARPLRFFARGTILDALLAARLHPWTIDAVRRPIEAEIPPGVDPASVRGADADVVGFVVTAGPTAAIGPDRGERAEAPSQPDWVDVRTAVRTSVADANERIAVAETERVRLDARLEELEIDRAALAEAVAAADAALAAVERRAAYRLVVGVEARLARVPGGTALARRLGSLVRRAVR